MSQLYALLTDVKNALSTAIATGNIRMQSSRKRSHYTICPLTIHTQLKPEFTKSNLSQMQSFTKTSSAGTHRSFNSWVISITMILLAVSLPFAKSYSQASLYSWASGTGASLEAISSPTVLTTVGNGSLDDGSNVITPAGFTFRYNNIDYTAFTASTNGYIRMGNNPTTSILSTLSSAAINGVFAFGRDGNINSANGGSMTHGTAAGGKYVFQFVKYSSSSAGSATVFADVQVVLWGSTSAAPGRIQIIWGLSAGTPSGSGAMGIVDAANTFVNGTNGSKTTATNPTTWPVSGTIYTFDPPVPCATPSAQPTDLILTPTAGSATSISGSFTAAVPASSGYLVLRTTSNVQPDDPQTGTAYTVGSTVLGGAVVVANLNVPNFVSTGLTAGTTYYFWVYSASSPCVGSPQNAYLIGAPLSGSATTNTPSAPGSCATIVAPANASFNVPYTQVLSWNAVTGVPTPTYDVYLSTNQSLVASEDVSARVSTGSSNLTFTPTLASGTTYYWKVVPTNTSATLTGCPVRVFSTAPPAVPTCNTTFTPVSGTNNLLTSQTLSWSGATSEPTIPVFAYDVYLDTSFTAVTSLSSAKRVATNITATTLSPSFSTYLLTPGLTYYWTVVSKNAIGSSTGCAVNSFSVTAPIVRTSTARGGLWNDVGTWVGGVIPVANDSVTIADGATVTLNTSVTVSSLRIGNGGSGTATLQWSSASTLNVLGDIIISSNGRLLPYTSATAGQTINVGGNFTNNGYTNLAVASTILNFNGSQVGGGSSSQTLGGSGVFEGDTTGGFLTGIIRSLEFRTSGSSTIATTQNLAAYTLIHTAGSLNTGGKLTVSNAPRVYGRPVNRQVTNLITTAMGSGYNATPIVTASGAALWVASTAVTLGQIRIAGNNVYVVTVAGTTGTVAPNHTSGAALNGPTATLLWVGNTGTIGLPFGITLTPAAGAQYFIGTKLFTAISRVPVALSAAQAATLASQASALTTIGDITAVNTDTLQYIGTAAQASANFENAGAGAGTIRSLTLDNAGSGYYTTAPTLSIIPTTVGAGSGAAATAILFQQIVGPANSLITKSPVAAITGGLTIKSDQKVASVQAPSGGLRYGGTPRVGFPLPTNFNNLMQNTGSRPGSGFTAAPTVIGRIAGGTRLANSTNPTFTAVVARGRVISVILTGGGTGWLTQPDSIKFAPNSGTDSAVIRFPVNALAQATPVLTNGTITNFIVTNGGEGYAAAPTPTLDSTGGVGTAAGTLTTTVGLYNLTYNFLAPATSNNEAVTGAEIPANNRINILTLGGTPASNFAKIKLNANLELYAGSGAIGLQTSTSYGSLLNLNGNTLNFSNPLYSGTGTTGAATNAVFGYVGNGAIRIALPGTSATGKTITFPFDAPLAIVTGGSATPATTGATMTGITVTQAGKPLASGPASRTPIGNRAWLAVADTLVGVSPFYGTNPTVTLTYNSTDSLISSLQQQFLRVGQSDSLNGTWITRSNSNASTSLLAVPAGSVTSATATSGPIVPSVTGRDYFGFTNELPAPTITGSYGPYCSGGGETVAITGTGFTNVSAVRFNGVDAASFTVNSATSITAVTPSGISAGRITVTATGAVGTSAAAYAITSTGVFDATAATQNPANGLICSAGGTVSISLNDIGANSYTWTGGTGPDLDTRTGLNVVASPAVSTTYKVSAAFGTCTVTKDFYIGVLASASIVPTATPANSCFVNGATVSLNANLPAGNFSVAPITYAAATAPPSARFLIDRGTTTPDFTFSGSQDDGGWQGVPIGFTYNFFGNFYNNLAVGTNGVLMFGPVPGFGTTAGQLGQYAFNSTGGVFPNFANPGNIIAAFASDQHQGITPTFVAAATAACSITSGSAIVTLAPGNTTSVLNVGDSISGTGIPVGTLIQSITNSSTFVMSAAATATNASVTVTFNEKPIIRYWTEGTAPTRRFVIEYAGSRNFNVTRARSYVQCMLYETSGIVEVHVNKIAAGTGNAAKTIGLQDATKTIGAVAPGRQFFTNAITTPEAWRFSPPTNYSFAWKPSAGINDTTLAAPTYTVTSPGTKNVSLVVTNPVTGCVTTTPLSFVVSPTPTVPSVTGTLSVCGSGSTALFASAPGSGNRIRWYDAANSGTLLATGTLFVTPNITATTTFYVAEESALCSSPRTPVTVTITPPDTLTVLNRTVCSGTSAINLTVSSDIADYDTYIWSPTTNLFQDAALLVPYTGQSTTSVYVKPPSNAFQQDYVCTANSFATLCGTKDTATVTVQPPTVSISSSNSICITGSSVLSLTSASPVAKNSVQWQVSTTSSTSGFTDVVGSITDTLQTGTISATRYYRAFIKNELGATCTTTDVFTLTVDNPVVSGTTPANRCGTGPVTLSATPTGGDIKWYAASTGGSSLKDSSSYSIPSISATTNYFASLTVNGCEGPRTQVTATVTAPSEVTLTSGGTICNTAIVPLSVTSNLPDFNSYIWTPTAGLFTDPAAENAYTGGTATTLYFKNTLSGTYTYSVTATNSVSGCSNTASTSVTVLPGAITISPSTASICRTGTASFGISPSAGFGTGTLQWETSATSPVTGFTVIGGETGTTYETGTLSTAGTTYYRVVLTDGTNTCVTAAASSVTVNNPLITGTTPDTLCGPGSLTLSATSASDTINWYSTNTSSTVLGMGTSFTANVTSTRQYFAAAVENGCVGTRTAVTATITSTPELTPSTASQNLACDAVSAAQIYVTSTPPGAFDSYTWTASAPGILYTDAAATTPYTGTSLDTIFVKTPVAGTYTITATASNSSTLCTNTAVSTVIVTALNPITLSSASQVVCNDGIAEISVTSTLANYDTYVWTPATGLYTDASATIPYVPGASADTVYARSSVAGTTVYTVSGSTVVPSCVGTATSSVTIQPSAATVSSSVSTLCRTGSAVITLNYTGSFAAGTIQWQRSTTSSSSGFTDITGSNSDTLQTGTITDTTYYRVQIKDGLNAVCFTTSAATVTVNNPTVAGTTPGSRCGTGAITLRATPSEGAAISWFANSTGGNALKTDTSYTTGSLSAPTTTFWVSAAIIGATPSCVSTPRIAVVATITEAPTVTLTPSQTVCNNAITPLTITSNKSAYNSYVWSPTAGLFTDAAATIAYTGGSADTVYFRKSAVGTSTYTVAATNSTTFCTFNTASTTVAVQPAAATLATSVSSICISGTSVLSLNPSTGYATGSIQWRYSTDGTNFSDTTSAGTASSLTTNTLTATRHYAAEIRSSTGICIPTNIVTIVVSNPQVSGTTPDTLCGTGTVTVSATSASGELNWYTAATGGTSLTPGGSASYTPALPISSTTTYYVGRTVGTCEGTRTAVTATVTPALSLTVSPITQTVCNDVLSAPINVTSNLANYTSYVWTPSTGLFTDAVGTGYLNGASATTVYVKTTNPGLQVYTLTATNSGTGCVSILRDTVRVQPAAASITPNSPSICVSGTDTLSLTSATLFAPGTTQWQESSGAGFADVSGSTATTFITPANTSNKSYQVVVKDGTGNCFTTDPVTVTYNNPTVNLSSSNVSRCGAGTIALSATAPVGTINWYANATGGSPVAGGANTDTLTIPFLAGTSVYYVSATDNGCEGTRLPDTATVDAPPTLLLTSDQIVCNGAITALRVLSNVSNYQTYVWSPADSLFRDTTLTVPYVTGTSASVVYAKSSRAGSVTYTVNANNPTSGCSTLDSVSLSVQPVFATVNSSPESLCFNGVATLSLAPSTGYSPGTIQWQRSTDDATYIDIPAAIGTTLTTPFQSTTRFYRAFVKNGTGAFCFTTPNKALVINNPSITSFSTGTLCQNNVTALAATAAPAEATINWFNAATGGSSLTPGGSASYTPPVSASVVTYYAQASIGTCLSSRAQSVTVRPSPVILSRTGTPATICSGQNVTLTATTSATTANTWVWTNNSTTVLTTNTGTVSPVNASNAPVTVKYFVVATDTSAALCTSLTDSVTITVNPAPVTPTAQPATISLIPASTSVTIAFTPASGNPGGYLVVRSATQPNAPVDNTVYTASATFNASLNGTVVGVGQPPFTDNFGIAIGTTYTYWVYSYNGGDASCSTTLYLTSVAPATASTTTCGLPPVSSAATAVLGNGFTANWAVAAGATDYQVDVSTSPTFAVGSFVAGYNPLVVAGGSTVSAAITGLNPGTTYYYRVRAVNGTCESSNSGTQTVTTYFTIPWIETFAANTTAPAGWSRTSNVLVGTTINGAGNSSIFSNLWSSNQTDTITLPIFTPVPSGHTLSYQYSISPFSTPTVFTGAAWGSFQLQVSTDFGATWSDLGSPVSAGTPSGYVTNNVDISAYAGSNANVSFRINSTWTTGDVYLNFDNFRILAPCVTPTTQPGTPTATATSASINGSFTPANAPGASSYLVLRTPTGVAPSVAPVNGTAYVVGSTLGNATITSAGSATTFAATGLTPSTTYRFTVYAYNDSCSGGAPFYNTTAPANAEFSTTASASYVSNGSGLWSQPATWIPASVPNINDTVTILNSHTVTIDIPAVAARLTISNGATLQYDGVAARSLTVPGDVTVDAGGNFIAAAAGSTSTVTTNSLLIGGSLTNNGNIDFSTTGGPASTVANATGVNLTFNGAANTSFSGSGTTDLRGLVINEANAANVVEITAPFSVQGTTSDGAPMGFVTLTQGILKLSGTHTIASRLFSSATYTIPATAGIWLNNPNFTVTAQNGSVTNNGTLRISNGNYNIGTTGANSLISAATGSIYNFDGGFLTVSGGFNGGASTNVSYTQSAGTVTVSTQGFTTSSVPSFGFTSTAVANSFTMSGGTIVIARPSTAVTPVDYQQAGGTVTIGGGTLQFGNASTIAGSVFNISNLASSNNINTPDISVGAPVSPVAVTVNVAGTGTGSLNVNGSLFVQTGCTLNHSNSAGQQIRLLGNVNNAGGLSNSGAITNTGSINNRISFTGIGGNNTTPNAGTNQKAFFNFAGGTIGTGTVPYAGIINIDYAGGVLVNAVNRPIISRLNLITGAVQNADRLQFGIGGVSSATIQRGGDAASVAGTLDIAPFFNLGTGGLNLRYDAALAAVTTGFEVPSPRNINSLVVNNNNGVTLADGALNTRSLDLTAGVLTTDATTNTLTVTGTAGINVARTAGWVNGPLTISLPASLVPGSVYRLPVGKTAFNGFDLISPTTTTAATVTAEYFAEATGGSAIGSMLSLYDGYWTASSTGGYTSSTVRVNTTGINITSDALAKSDGAVNGNYDLVGTTNISTTGVSSNAAFPQTTLGTYALGVKALPMTYVSSTTTQASTAYAYTGVNDQEIIRVRIITANNSPALTLDDMTFNSNGSTAGNITSNVTSAKLYYTGASTTFSTANQVGSGVLGSSLGSDFTFTPSSTLSLLPGNNYFWLVYDVDGAAIENDLLDAECVQFSITDGASQQTTPSPTPTAPAGNRVIRTPLSGTYTIGPSEVSPNFTTLTAAMAALDDVGAGGAVSLLLQANYTGAGETFPVTINAFQGASATNTLTIKPNAAGVNMTGSSSSAIFVINGADFVTIDGSVSATANTICPPSAASRDLTITNTSTSTTSAVVWLQTATGSNAATNNVIKNCNIVGNGNTQTLYGIGSGGTTISTTSLGTGNNNNSFVNNNIRRTQIGIYSQGASAASKNSGNIINQNLVNTATPNNVSLSGIRVGFEDGITIAGNTIDGITNSASVVGIGLGMFDIISATTTAGNEVTNATVTNNIIGSVVNSSTNSAAGITVASATSGTTLIANNRIYGVAANSTGGDIAAGIILGGGTGSTTNVYHNTVSMQGTITGATAASQTSACLAVTATTSPVLNINNNIFSNTQVGNTSATLRLTAIALGYSTFAGLSSNNNDLFAGGAGPGTYVVGITGGVVAGTSRGTLANWQTTTSTDAASKNVAPVFVSATDLHLSATNASNTSDLVGFGTPGLVTTDIDCETRGTGTPNPTIGADELVPCAGAEGGTAVAPATTTFCGSSTVGTTITASGYSSALNGTYQWQSSLIGDFTDAVDIVGATNPASYTISPAITTTTHYRLKVTCTSGTAIDFSNTITFSINAAPTAVITATGGTFYCTPLPQPITLTASTNFSSPAPQYQWKLDGADISGETNASFNPNGVLGNYTVVVTNTSNSCATTSDVTAVAIAQRPTATANATPNPLCLDAALTLTSTGTATGGLNNGYPAAPASIPYGPVADPGGAAVVTGDDQVSTIQTLPFTFNYYGTDFTNLFVSTNGFITLGTTAPASSNTPQTIPNTATPNNVIAGIWSDLNPNDGGTIRTYTTGSVGSRIYTVHYDNVAFFSAGTSNADVYIQLYEGTNDIEVHLRNVVLGTGGDVPTVGIENSTGTAASFPAGRNNTAFNISTPEAWRFERYRITDYSWSGNGGYTAAVQNPPAFNVAAANAGVFTVTVTDRNGCTGTAQTSPVVVNPLPTITTAASTPDVTRLSTAQTTTLGYTATTETPTTYSINFDAAAEAEGFVDVTNAALPATPIVINVPANVNAATYNATLTVRNANNCNSSTANAFTITVINGNPVWTGNTNTDWNTGSNWSSGLVPAPGVNVTIDRLTANNPVLASNVTVGIVDILPANTLTLNGFTLTANGGITTSAGLLIGSNTSNLVLGATSTLRFGQTGTQPVLKDLTVNAGTATLATPLSITGGLGAINTNGTVTVANGAILASNGNLTFKSNVFGSARLAAGATSGQWVTGNVTVERYIPQNAQRAWRFLSVPTKGAQTIKQSWQENATPLNMNPRPNFGTIISSPFANYSALGFDDRSAKASMQFFNQASGTTGAWVDVNSTLSTGNVTRIETLKGYALYVRGDRTQYVAGPVTTTTSTTLRTTGTLYTGDQSAITIGSGRFDLIGNTYVSPIDFTGLTRTNLVNSFYLWDPKLVTGTPPNVSLGGYVTFSLANSWVGIPNSSSYGTTPRTTIQSGEAFMIQANAGGGSITLRESAKIVGDGANFFRPTSPTTGFQKMKANLLTVATDNTTVMADANVSVFDNAFSNAVDGDDAVKLSNAGENFAIRRGTTNLVVEGRQLITSYDTTNFWMWGMRQNQQYRLELIAENMNIEGRTAFLVDNFTNTTTQLDLAVGTTNYNFTITAEPGSSVANRFRILYRQVQLAPVPVSFVSVTAQPAGAAIKVDWKVAQESGIRQYVVERSSDGRNFTGAGYVVATGNRGGEASYAWLDATPVTGSNFYRIRSVGVNGEIKYSPIVKVLNGNVLPSFTIAPNPVEGSVVNIQFKNQLEGRYTLRLLASTGETVFTAVKEHAGGTSTQVVELPSTIARGAYQLEIITPGKDREVQTLFINTLK